MNIITLNDIIFATATVRGAVAANLRLSGLRSMTEVINAIRHEIGSFTGIITISLRNMTQGWTQQKSLYLTPVAINR